MDMIKAMIYGIVEGITEWLPIRSTGHMILLERLLSFQGVGEDFFNVFDVVIQLGAIMAVVVLFWKQIWPFGLVPKEQEQWNRSGIIVKKDIWNLWLRILVSCMPAAVVGILFDDLFTALFYNPVCVAMALILFGIAFIVIERRNKKAVRDYLPNGCLYRCVSDHSGNLSGNVPVGSNDHRCIVDRRFKGSGCGVYVFPCNSCNVWCEHFKNNKAWVFVYRAGNDDRCLRGDGCIYGIHCCASIFYQLCEKA